MCVLACVGLRACVHACMRARVSLVERTSGAGMPSTVRRLGERCDDGIEGLNGY